MEFPIENLRFGLNVGSIFWFFENLRVLGIFGGEGSPPRQQDLRPRQKGPDPRQDHPPRQDPTLKQKDPRSLWPDSTRVQAKPDQPSQPAVILASSEKPLKLIIGMANNPNRTLVILNQTCKYSVKL